ncbi:MAG TPA: hypothetical protein VFF06_27560 [Polyangia bacterium]|nr:hypothetical protein [Polyangia bacterium]
MRSSTWLSIVPLAALAATALAGCGRHEPSVILGASQVPGYHLLANVGTEIPAGDIGYLVTANGQGGYRVAFVDTEGSAARFSGSITTDVAFDPTQTFKINGAESVVATSTNRIDFAGVPGATVEGVDCVAQTDPIYIDVQLEGSRGVNIYFTGAHSGIIETSFYNPVAFTSP